MGTLNEFHGGLQSLISGISGALSQGSTLHNKIEKTLQLSIATVTFRNNDFTKFRVKIGEIEYPAVLFFDSQFYALVGYPKLGEYSIVIHNNGNNAHIMFPANKKNLLDPPLGGDKSRKTGIISSAKCFI